jgi:hypothetical protein
MSKRARYDGPHEEVFVFDSEAGVNSRPIDTVKRGKWLSADVPARIRDELLATDYWTEVQEPTSSKKGDD